MSAWENTKFNSTPSTFVEPNSVARYGVYKEHSNVFRPGESSLGVSTAVVNNPFDWGGTFMNRNCSLLA